MKYIIKFRFLLLILGVILMSAGVTSSLTKRSTGQVILHSNNMNSLTIQVNSYYNQGYRITNMVSQSVSNGTSAPDRYRVIYGEVIIIMER